MQNIAIANALSAICTTFFPHTDFSTVGCVPWTTQIEVSCFCKNWYQINQNSFSNSEAIFVLLQLSWDTDGMAVLNVFTVSGYWDTLYSIKALILLILEPMFKSVCLCVCANLFIQYYYKNVTVLVILMILYDYPHAFLSIISLWIFSWSITKR